MALSAVKKGEVQDKAVECTSVIQMTFCARLPTVPQHCKSIRGGGGGHKLVTVAWLHHAQGEGGRTRMDYSADLKIDLDLGESPCSRHQLSR